MKAAQEFTLEILGQSTCEQTDNAIYYFDIERDSGQNSTFPSIY